MEDNKTIITLEKEPVYIDGILHYKRTLKKNDKIICEDTVTEESEKTKTPKINMFEEWVKWLENNKDGKIEKNNGEWNPRNVESNTNS